MKITSLTKHNSHQMRIHYTRGLGPHYAALRCVECNKHIQWLSFSATQLLISMGIDVKTEIKNVLEL